MPTPFVPLTGGKPIMICHLARPTRRADFCTFIIIHKV
jgi:hypothetical protein